MTQGRVSLAMWETQVQLVNFCDQWLKKKENKTIGVSTAFPTKSVADTGEKWHFYNVKSSHSLIWYIPPGIYSVCSVNVCMGVQV